MRLAGQGWQAELALPMCPVAIGQECPVRWAATLLHTAGLQPIRTQYSTNSLFGHAFLALPCLVSLASTVVTGLAGTRACLQQGCTPTCHQLLSRSYLGQSRVIHPWRETEDTAPSRHQGLLAARLQNLPPTAPSWRGAGESATPPPWTGQP